MPPAKRCGARVRTCGGGRESGLLLFTKRYSQRVLAAGGDKDAR